jgi:hypothetical protein
MDLVAFTSRLADAGLATYMFSPESDWIRVGVPRDPLVIPEDHWVRVEPHPPPYFCLVDLVTVFGRTVTLERWDLREGQLWVADPARVYWYEERWSFCCDGCPRVGGVGLEQVQSFRDSLDEMYELVWSYYFREPILIGGWRVPLYQQPNWRREEVENAIANATIKTTSELAMMFREDRERWGTRHERKVLCEGEVVEILPTMDDLLHYVVENPGDPTRRLHIRYDCKEAFIERVAE